MLLGLILRLFGLNKKFTKKQRQIANEIVRQSSMAHLEHIEAAKEKAKEGREKRSSKKRKKRGKPSPMVGGPSLRKSKKKGKRRSKSR